MLVDWGIFMGVLNLSFKVVPIEKKDLLEINKILIKEIGSSQLPHLKECLRNGLAKKMVVENKIAGFCLAFEYKTHFSLSYYYIYEEHRKKLQSGFFFFYCLNKMKSKQIQVEKNKNLNLYKRYFYETPNGSTLIFKGLREGYEWAEILAK